MPTLLLADDALYPVDPLWCDAVAHLARKLGRVVPLDPAGVPADRGPAIAHLDAWAGREAGNWRVEIGRFYADHVPVYLRPDPELNSTLRRLASEGVTLGVWSPGPSEALAAVTHFLGLERRLSFQAVDPDPAVALAAAGAGSEDGITVVAASPALLAAGKAAGASTAAALWTGADRETLAAAAPDRILERPGDI